MDVIEASHMERLKQFISDKPGYEFRARKTKVTNNLPWNLYIINTDADVIVYEVWSEGMGTGLEMLSRWIYYNQQPKNEIDQMIATVNDHPKEQAGSWQGGTNEPDEDRN